jgi:hypothetical protein
MPSARSFQPRLRPSQEKSAAPSAANSFALALAMPADAEHERSLTLEHTHFADVISACNRSSHLSEMIILYLSELV